MSKELIEELRANAAALDGDLPGLLMLAADALEAKAAPVGEREAFEAAHKKLHPQVKIRVQNLVGAYTDKYVDHAAFWFSEGAAYQRAQQPSAGVVMPERKDHETYYDADEYRKDGWSAYIDEFARLNGKEVGCE